jgi:type I restriction enzyme R subunit
MYIDKPMKGHNLMQAIARVNRVYKDKEGGLIVDYIGIADDLRKALKVYSESGGRGAPTLDTEQAVHFFFEKLEIVRQMYHGFAYEQYYGAETGSKLVIILEAQEHILGLEDGKERYLREVTGLSKALSLVITEDEVDAFKEEVGFFQAVKARLAKFTTGRGMSREDVDSAIKRLVNEAIEAQDVVDVFDAAGIMKPDISILSDEFLQEVKRMKYKNIAAELLKKLLNDEIKIRTRWNMVEGKKFSEMLKAAVQKYENRFLSLPEFIEELMNLSKEMKKAEEKGEELGLSQDEYAFYAALAANKSAKEVMGDEQLVQLTHVLLQRVKDNTSIDWQYRENARARLRRAIKRLLREYGYPPDMQKLAMENVIKQAEIMMPNLV